MLVAGDGPDNTSGEGLLTSRLSSRRAGCSEDLVRQAATLGQPIFKGLDVDSDSTTKPDHHTGRQLLNSLITLVLREAKVSGKLLDGNDLWKGSQGDLLL